MPVARPFNWLLTVLALIMPAAILSDAEGADCEKRETADEVTAQVVFRHFI